MVTPHDRRTILRRYARGATLREIATDIGCHESTIRHMLDAAGIPRRGVGPRGRTDVPTALIVELRDDAGCSWQEIADACGMSRSGARGRYRVEAEGLARWR